MNRGHYYGYDFQGAQPCIRIAVKLHPDLLPDAAGFDAWLTDRLGVAPDDLASVQAKQHGGTHLHIRAGLERAFLLYGEMARGADLPCFDHGRLLRIGDVAEADGRFAALVAVPVVDSVARKVFARLLEAALDAVRDYSRVPEERVLTRLEKAVAKALVVNPLHGTSPVAMCRIAHRHGLPFRHLGGGVLRLGTGARSHLFNKSAVQADSAIGAAVCHDKRATARFLHAAGLPGAEHFAVSSPDAAVDAAGKLGWPVVVKPADHERAEGVTIGISDETALRAAYEKACALSSNILVERHVAGTCHRILVAADRILYAVKRVPKRVLGNGHDTIAALVETANARKAKFAPWKKFTPHALDAQALECLAADGFSPDSVLAEGQVAYFRPLASPEWGGEVDDLTRTMHPENADLAIAAARLFGLSMAGIDLITTDIAVPWHANGAIVNEVNFSPQLSVARREIDPSVLVMAMAPGEWRIPVHLITGSGDLDRAARNLQQRLAGSGRRCHATGARWTRGPDGREVHLPASTLFERSVMLSLRPDVQELIMVGSPDELFATGLAVDRIASANVVEADTTAAETLARRLSARFTVAAPGGVSRARVRSSRE